MHAPMANASTASLSRARPLMGTLVSVQVWPEAEVCTAAQARESLQAIEQALACVAQIARAMSAHDPNSDLGRMGRARAGECLQLNPHTVAVLRASQ